MAVLEEAEADHVCGGFWCTGIIGGSLGDFKSRGRTVVLNLDQSQRAAMNRLFALTQPASLNTFVELWETALHGRTRSSLVANTQAFDSNTRFLFLVCVTVTFQNPADGSCADRVLGSSAA